MNRREFGKQAAKQSGIVLAGSTLVASSPPAASAEEAPARKVERSPHVEALDLVFPKAAERIRVVDEEEDWWHDVKERAWVVQRPFSPGTIDSTHLFTVEYRIEGKRVAAWEVDTRAGTVREQAKEQRKEH
jgi:hypothetical protein